MHHVFRAPRSGVAVIFASLTLLTTAALAQTPQETWTLLKDVEPKLNGFSSAPERFFYVPSPSGPGKTFFDASAVATGEELYVTDGTTAGTSLVMDINPGPNGSAPTEFAEFNGKLMFCATPGIQTELWESDGTAAGTKMVSTIIPMGGTKWHTQGANAYFLCFSGGEALCRYDGTNPPAPIVSTASGSSFALLGPKPLIIFSGTDANAGGEPIAYDTTTGTPTLLADINPTGTGGSSAQGSSPDHFTVVGTRVFFIAQPSSTSTFHLYVTDGTPAGTVEVKTSTGASLSFNLFGSYMAAVGNQLLFSYDDGSGATLWKSDGTNAGTVKVDPTQQITMLSDFVTSGGAAYFLGYTAATGQEFFTSDGTIAGTKAIEVNPGPSNSFSNERTIAASGTRIFFAADDTGQGNLELWAYDTMSGLHSKVTEIVPGGGGASIGAVAAAPGGKVVFDADDGTSGLEPWVSDGTPAGTSLLDDIIPGGAPISSSPHAFTAFNGGAVFLATANGEQDLFFTDGTTAGTHFVATADTLINTNYVLERLVVGGALYFATHDNGTGDALWKYDGMTASKVTDLQPSSGFEPKFFLTQFQGKLFFASNGTAGNGLWLSDGTSAGTSFVSSLGGGAVEGIAAGTQHLYVLTQTVMTGGMGTKFIPHLWVSDGTTGGTQEIALTGINPASIAGAPLAVVGDTAFFAAAATSKGIELWSSDGTTATVEDIDPGSGSSLPTNFVVASDRLYFVANTAVSGSEVYFRKPADATSTRVSDVNTGSGNSTPQNLTLAGTRLFFTASPASGGARLYGYDGSAVTELTDGSGLPRSLVALDSRVLFWMDTNGVLQPWESDGKVTKLRSKVDGPQLFAVGESYALADAVVFAGQDAMETELYVTARDTTKPTVTVAITGTAGKMNWYRGATTAHFNVDEPELPEVLIPDGGCPDVTLTGETTVMTYTCDVSSEGGPASATAMMGRDDTPPMLICAPSPGVQDALSADGTAFSVPPPTMFGDELSGADGIPVSDAPAKFKIGVTTVHFSLADLAGNMSTCTVDVDFEDRTPPTIACDQPTKVATSPEGADVALQPTVQDAIDPAPTITFEREDQVEGTLFPIGETHVKVIATDAKGNSASCDSLVTVNAPPGGYFGDKKISRYAFGCSSSSGGLSPLWSLALLFVLFLRRGTARNVKQAAPLALAALVMFGAQAAHAGGKKSSSSHASAKTKTKSKKGAKGSKTSATTDAAAKPTTGGAAPAASSSSTPTTDTAASSATATPSAAPAAPGPASATSATPSTTSATPAPAPTLPPQLAPSGPSTIATTPPPANAGTSTTGSAAGTASSTDTSASPAASSTSTASPDATISTSTSTATATAPASSARKVKLAFLGVTPGGGVTTQDARTIEQALETELNGLGLYEIISRSMITTLVGIEREKELLGCSDASSSCLAEIADALNTERVVTADLSQVGETVVINMSLIDSKKGQTMGRVRREVSGDSVAPLLEQLKPMVYDLANLDPARGDKRFEMERGFGGLVVGLRGDADFLTPGLNVLPALTAELSGKRLGVALTVLASLRPGARLEGRFYPVTLGPVRPYLGVGTTAFASGVAARGALGVTLRLSRIQIFADVAYERYLLDLPSPIPFEDNALVVGLGTGWAL